MNIPRTITIKPVLNGFVCQVGCQTVVFSKREDLLGALRDYLTNPDEYEKYFRDKALHKGMIEGPAIVDRSVGTCCGQQNECCEVPPPPPEPKCQENIHPRDRSF